MASGGSAPVQGFPVHWPYPGDEALRWELRGSGQQVRPLLADLERLEFDAFARNKAVCGGPREERRFEQFHGYLYEHSEPSDPDAVKAWRARPPESLLAAAADPLATWHDRLLPPVRRALARLETTDFDAVSWAELQSHLDDALALDEQVELTIGAIEWAHDLPGRFLDLDRALFGEEHLPVALDLFAGMDCLLLHMVRDLVELQRLVHEMPHGRRVLEERTADTAGSLVAGRTIQRALRRFLDQHGRRFEFRDLWEPSWREDPSPVLALLRGDDPRPGWNPDASYAERQQARAAAEAAVRSQLEAVAPERQGEYWERRRIAREALIVHEDYDVWMQQRCRVALREVLIAFARRFTRTARLEDPADLWWLRLRELLVHPYSTTDWALIVARRKAEWARWSTVTPPRQLGAVDQPANETPPAGPTPSEEGTGRPERYSGTGASRGTMRGRAVIVRSWADAGRIGPGDIVVAQWMTPSSTLLLTRAAGVVAQWGSPLDRTAMVARQLDIPAVLGCRDAARWIQDGDTIELDADTGTVTLSR